MNRLDLAHDYAKILLANHVSSDRQHTETFEDLALQATKMADALLKQLNQECEIKKTIPLDTLISNTEMRDRTKNLLLRHNICTVEDAINMSRVDLLKLPDLGKGAMMEVKACLEEYGLNLKGEG